MGERSTPMAVELLASALFAAGRASTVIAVELPASRAGRESALGDPPGRQPVAPGRALS